MAVFFPFIVGFLFGILAMVFWALFMIRDISPPPVAGEEIRPGDPVYLHRDGKWYRARRLTFEEMDQ